MRDILIELNEYISGGYYLARLGKRAKYMSPALVPDQVLSASPGICDCFPDAWAVEWTSENCEARSKKSAAFGIAQNDLPDVIAWATASFGNEFGWPSAFYDLDTARKAR